MIVRLQPWLLLMDFVLKINFKNTESSLLVEIIPNLSVVPLVCICC